ncbi:uncharacterized protein LOC111060628 isoform X3 [Nilaparvata lugens]|uniref:uncharacterized protein LOC111060628 isoform X3 n=1 Tax=Nilaparvata lugens TaxID=108931 RepID=UPI00193D2497|nr:uncharacterized protein LOC111060628 isoform X3 [Nilaparvata lugens]
MAENICTVFDRGCFHCAKSQKPGNENRKTRVSKMVYHYPQIGSLLIQETTTQVEKIPKEFPKKVIKTDKPVEVSTVGKQTPNFDLEHEQPVKLKHCWSGITFIEEKYARERENAYNANLKIVLANRRRWTRMQRSIERQIRSRQMKICGPEWYQDLSYKQLSLLEAFPDVLKRDTEEKSVSNTRKFLKDLGIMPLPDNEFLQELLEKCKRDPLYYFDQIRKDIRYRENQRLQALRGEKEPISDVEIAKRKYSVSERILLSAMFTIHLPLLLFKLHLILPQVTTKSKTEVNILSPLPSEMVSSLPEPKKKWFKSRKPDAISFDAIDESFGIAEPKTVKDDQLSNDQESLCDSTDDFKCKQKTPSSLSDLEMTAKLVDVSVQTDIHDTETTTHPTQSDLNVKDGKIPEKLDLSNLEKKKTSVTGFVSIKENEDMDNISASKGSSSVEGSDNIKNENEQLEEISLNPHTDYEKVIAIMMASIVRVPTDTESEKRDKIKECLETYNIEGLYEIFGIDTQQKINGNKEETGGKGRANHIETPSVLATGSEQTPPGFESNVESTASETKLASTETGLEKLIAQLREAILQQPKKKQLKYALSILANAGDPLASFPDIQKCQPIIRWYEIRTGLKKKLNDSDREKLLGNSRKAWSVLMSNRSCLSTQKIPRCILTSKQLASYTWDRKKWAMNKINTALNNHKRNIRQAMVDDARILYSTMDDFHYDSKLNTNIRKTFFTYLPSAETEIYV